VAVAVEWRQGFRAPALVLAVLAAEATIAWGNALHAPWSGVVITFGAGMLVAVGLIGGVWGVLVAVAVTAVAMVGADLVDDGSIEMAPSEPSYRGACDPSCGLGLGGALLLTLPLVGGLAGVGAALRRLTRRLG
jgi:hypothetical protein